MTIQEFFHFAGLSYGESIDKVLDIYGVPDDEFKHDDRTYFVFYYKMVKEYALNISFSSENLKIESIFLGLHTYRAARLLLEKFHVHEPKALYIGSSMDEIIDTFGIPNEQNRKFITYKANMMEVEFFFPVDEKSLCSRIKVKWFYN